MDIIIISLKYSTIGLRKSEAHR